MLQCIVIWTVFLGLLPLFLMTLEHRLGVSSFTFVGQRAIGVALFFAFSALNLATGGVLSRQGEGTPLPLDCPRRLVLTGPYAHVRNPMAIAGLGQGLAVVLGLGSWFGLVYVALGIFVWQVAARPAEERDLRARFGSAYDNYARAVQCWVPHLQPYHADADG